MLAAPTPGPESVLRGEGFFDNHTRLLGMGVEPGRYPVEVIDAYRRQLAGPMTIEAICEDYRAGATIDRELDERDRGRLIECPLLVLWAARGALPRLYDDVLDVWREWAKDVRGRRARCHALPRRRLP